MFDDNEIASPAEFEIFLQRQNSFAILILPIVQKEQSASIVCRRAELLYQSNTSMIGVSRRPFYVARWFIFDE